jgi:GMP synthase-like glutamine amidotransferase
MARWNTANADCLEGDIGDYSYDRIAGSIPEETGRIRLPAISGQLPADVPAWATSNRVAALIISGSFFSPLDDFPWIRSLEQFVRSFVPTGLPLLGICFGHEVLANALGGELSRRDEHTVAFRDVRIDTPDPLFKGLGPTTRQPIAHEVFVRSAPPGFDVIASSFDIAVQAMRGRSAPVYGVQFHPEVDVRVKQFDPDWDAIPDHEYPDSEGPALMRNFMDIALEHAARKKD